MTFFEEYCISVGTDSHSSSRPSMKPLQFYWILCCLFSLLSLVAGYNGNFFQRIARDFKALSSRSTTRWLTTCMHKNSIPLRHLAHRLRSWYRHILLPKDPQFALTVKQNIRNKVKEKIFVIDAFAEAALEFSQDTESAKVGGKSTDNFTF